MEQFENILVAICVFGSGVSVVFILARYNYLLKKSLAEKGVTPHQIKIKYPEIGCVVIGIGFGLAASSIFTTMDLSEDTMDLLVWAVILMGGGLGLFGAHFVRQRLEGGE